MYLCEENEESEGNIFKESRSSVMGGGRGKISNLYYKQLTRAISQKYRSQQCCSYASLQESSEEHHDQL